MEMVSISKALQRKLKQVSEKTGRRPEQLVAAALQEKLEYEEWVLKRIEEGVSDIEAGRLVSTEELVGRLKSRGARRVGGRRKAA